MISGKKFGGSAETFRQVAGISDREGIVSFFGGKKKKKGGGGTRCPEAGKKGGGKGLGFGETGGLNFQDK